MLYRSNLIKVVFVGFPYLEKVLFHNFPVRKGKSVLEGLRDGQIVGKGPPPQVGRRRCVWKAGWIVAGNPAPNRGRHRLEQGTRRVNVVVGVDRRRRRRMEPFVVVVDNAVRPLAIAELLENLAQKVHQRKKTRVRRWCCQQVVYLVGIHGHVVQFLFPRTPLGVQQIGILGQFGRAIDDPDGLVRVWILRTNKPGRATTEECRDSNRA